MESDGSLVEALDSTGQSQTFCPLSDVKHSPGQERMNYSFKVLSDRCITMPKKQACDIMPIWQLS